MTDVHLWIDASAGVAGDMLLGALVDAGADLAAVQRAVDAVAPDSVRLTAEQVTRGGQRATKLHVEVRVDDPPHRTWASIRETLRTAELDPRTARWAHATFALLAEAEARAHGIPPEDVHFHEVGALDSVADVVGTCEAARLLGVGAVTASPIAVGSGRIGAAHGDIPVPVPAVANLALGWPVTAGPGGAHRPADLLGGHDHGHGHPHAHSHDHDHGQPEAHAHDHSPADGHDHAAGDHGHPHSAVRELPEYFGELATPTGVALVRALADRPGPLPALTPTAVGVGAGTRDLPGRPNVVRVVLGDLTVPSDAAPTAAQPTRHPESFESPRAAHSHHADSPTEVAEVRATVDDLDPRLWPGVLDALLAAGALDAWLAPVLMKKGRPGHVVTALVAAGDPDAVRAVEDALLEHTSTLGVRRSAALHRRVLQRTWRTVEPDLPGDTAGREVRVKIGHEEGRIRTVTPEFADVAAAARAAGVPERTVLDAARAAAAAAGLVTGATMEP